jgi:hypothetical protein
MLENWQGLQKVISGGQTGADQGGLLAAWRKNIKTGGTAPEGWATTAGPNPLLQCLGLVAQGTLKTRTEWNIKDSDGTVILTERFSSPGSVLTRNLCIKHSKPLLDIDIKLTSLEHTFDPLRGAERTALNQAGERLYQWIQENQITVLNVAGNRERKDGTLITERVACIVGYAFELLLLDGLIVSQK